MIRPGETLANDIRRQRTQQSVIFHVRRFARDGADERSRTFDLLITNQLLYQLSYIGENVVHFRQYGVRRQACFIRDFRVT